MKTTLITLLFLAQIFTGYTQSAYVDAIKISRDFVQRSDTGFTFKPAMALELASYLKAYLPDSIIHNDSFVLGQVIVKYTRNPFFGKEISPLRNSGASAENTVAKSNIFSRVGGLAIPNEILLGITDWIVHRTKQELNSYFFDHFRSAMENYPDLQSVFPQTYHMLHILGNEVYNYQRYIKSLQAAFQNDASQLVYRFPTIIDNHPGFFSRHAQLAATLEGGFYIIGGLQEEKHPGDILNDFPETYLDPLNPNWKCGLRMLKLVSASLQNEDSGSGESYWATPKQIRELIQDDVAFKIYLGLVYQQAKSKYQGIPIQTTVGSSSIVSLLDDFAPKFDEFHLAYGDFITRFSMKANRVQQLIHDFNDEASAEDRFQYYYTYYNAVLDLIEHCTAISSLPFIEDKLPNLQDSLKIYFDVARSSADLFLQVRSHEYSSAIANAVNIYQLVKSDAGEKDAINTTLTKTERETAATFAPAKTNLLKYGAFMAAICDADTPEKVEAVIENFALPPGSSRIKRQSQFNVALNAYCGLFTGNEIIRELDPDRPFSGLNSFGVTAPIGISFSKGYRYLPFPISEIGLFRQSQKEWASTWFITLVDLGAVAAYRFTNDEVDEVPSVQLKDIFSPGLFWSLGFPKSPLSFTLGAQTGPNLRKVQEDENKYAGNLYVRYSMSLTVDLPVLNFYTKSK